jgi:hypothetical protein
MVLRVAVLDFVRLRVWESRFLAPLEAQVAPQQHGRLTGLPWGLIAGVSVCMAFFGADILSGVVLYEDPKMLRELKDKQEFEKTQKDGNVWALDEITQLRKKTSDK